MFGWEALTAGAERQWRNLSVRQLQTLVTKTLCGSWTSKVIFTITKLKFIKNNLRHGIGLVFLHCILIHFFPTSIYRNFK